MHRLEIAVQACRDLLEENEQLKKVLPEWSEPRPNHRECAAWALKQELDGKVSLRPFERSFLGTVRYWGNDLTPRQRPVFERIMDRVESVTGEISP